MPLAWGFRYSSVGDSRSLYYSTDVETLELMYPDSKFMREVSGELGREGRLIVSEPLGDRLRRAHTPVRDDRGGN